MTVGHLPTQHVRSSGFHLNQLGRANPAHKQRKGSSDMAMSDWLSRTVRPFSLSAQLMSAHTATMSAQVTLYHALTLSGVNPPTVVPEADVILQGWLEYLGSFL